MKPLAMRCLSAGSLIALVTLAFGQVSLGPVAASSALRLSGVAGRAETNLIAPVSPAQIRRLSATPTQRMVIILRSQFSALRGRTVSALTARREMTTRAQRPLLHELRQVHAREVEPFHIIDAIRATVSVNELRYLRSQPLVRAVVPDMVIPAPRQMNHAVSARAVGVSRTGKASCTPSLEPEALQLTQTAYRNRHRHQALNLVTGKGVTVAYLADGININNPDFIRANGKHVFVDYKDFSGDGPNAPTPGGEAFTDAGSIAAQGREVYSLNSFLNKGHAAAGCPNIRIMGTAPGASLMGLKVFGQLGAFESSFVAAIQYAVDHGAGVINESFGGYSYPDNRLDPTSLADKQAVADGVVVTVSSGDAGTAGALGPPATLPQVITVGASTQFRAYKQTLFAGDQLGKGGYLSDNISSLSSGGITQGGGGGVDVVAPGDLGWGLCDANTKLYADCLGNNGKPSPIQLTGGTSESAPLTAGEAALVIEAYRGAHHGKSPSPAVVKQIIMSTAVDLGEPSYEQGAGLIDSLRAVNAAISYNASRRQGDALLVTPSTLSASGAAGSTKTFHIHVTNDGSVSQVVQPQLQAFGSPTYHHSYGIQLDPRSKHTFVDEIGVKRAYVIQKFQVPSGAQRLDASIAWDVAADPSGLARVTLFDPKGDIAAYSLPQDLGPPVPFSGYGHVDVRFPASGTWEALIWTKAAPSSSSYKGGVTLDVSTSNQHSVAHVSPAKATLGPGQSRSFSIRTKIGHVSGDLNGEVTIGGPRGAGASSQAGAVPVTLRSLIPLGSHGGTFDGTLTGGNGRPGAPGQVLTYQFRVPSRLKSLGLNTSIKDNHYNLEGVLVNPSGMPVNVESTITKVNTNQSSDSFGLPTRYTNTMQFFQANPSGGLWKFVVFINNNISGVHNTLPIDGRISFNTVDVTASGLPQSPKVRLGLGSKESVSVHIKNTGNTAKSYFVDPRLNQTAPLSLGGGVVTVPFDPSNSGTPVFLVPPLTTQFTVLAESSAPKPPVSIDVVNANGAPPYGEVGSPEVSGYPFIDPGTGDSASIATLSGSQVPFGFWLALPSEIGPFSKPAPNRSVNIGALATTKIFDVGATPATGDLWAIAANESSHAYKPLVLQPGKSGTITVRIQPSAPAGTSIHGVLYVDAAAIDSNFLITGSGDQVALLPYSYTVK